MSNTSEIDIGSNVRFKGLGVNTPKMVVTRKIVDDYFPHNKQTLVEVMWYKENQMTFESATADIRALELITIKE